MIYKKENIMRNTIYSICLSVFAMIVMAIPAIAASEDEGLYDALPPEGSAFVRFIHAQEIDGDIPPNVNGKDRDGVKFTGVKPYGVVAPGTVKAALGPATVEFEADPSSFYTLILQNDELRVFKDPTAESKLKSQIIVYNMTKRDDISLRTADGKVTIIGPLAANEIKDREINPIKVSFAIYSGDEKFADMVDWPLERKESYVVAVFERKDGEGVATYDRARLSEE